MEVKWKHKFKGKKKKISNFSKVLINLYFKLVIMDFKLAYIYIPFKAMI